MNKKKSEFFACNQKIIYLKNQAGNVGIYILPKDYTNFDEENAFLEPAVHVFVRGDKAHTGFANGATMKYSSTTYELKYVSQSAVQKGDVTQIITILKTNNGLSVSHYLELSDAYNVTKSYCKLTNNSKKEIAIDFVTSFALNANVYNNSDNQIIEVVRLQSFWAAEGKKRTETLEDLHFEKSWSNHGIRFLKYGATGSLPIKEYFPFGAIKDTANNLCTAVLLDVPYSWQCEITRYADELSFSGGTSDREFGHFSKTLKEGESIVTQKAYISVVAGDEEDCLREINLCLNQNIKYVAKSEESVPAVFNEFCTTWGTPSFETVKAIGDKIKDMGFGYFVIDAGWYMQKESGFKGGFYQFTGECEDTVGDWEIGYELFPNGIIEAADYLRDLGLLPGLWFEAETVCDKSNMLKENPHLMLKKDDALIVAGRRSFLDMRKEEVHKHLNKKVVELLRANHFNYIKVDYNENIGIGCDGAESLGEGLRQNILGALKFYHNMHKKIPDLVFENCASGSHRCVPSVLEFSSMNSFSDAHECLSIPIIAANIGKIVPTRQNQVWSVLRQKDDKKRLYYSLCSNFIGRMCISGDVHLMSAEQLEVLKEGVSFYNELKELIFTGKQYVYRTTDKKYANPIGSQVVVRKNNNQMLVVGHAFNNRDNITVKMPKNATILREFGTNMFNVSKAELVFAPNEDLCGCALLFSIKED